MKKNSSGGRAYLLTFFSEPSNTVLFIHLLLIFIWPQYLLAEEISHVNEVGSTVEKSTQLDTINVEAKVESAVI